MILLIHVGGTSPAIAMAIGSIKNDMKIGISCIPQYTVEKIEVDFSEEDARRFNLI